MLDLYDKIQEAKSLLQQKWKGRPTVGIILGTGLGDFAGALEAVTRVRFEEIPHFPVSTVEGHAGELHVGRLAGRVVAVMKGRVHYYEGYTMQQVAFPVRVLKAIGCGTLIISDASTDGEVRLPDIPQVEDAQRRLNELLSAPDHRGAHDGT